MFVYHDQSLIKKSSFHLNQQVPDLAPIPPGRVTNGHIAISFLKKSPGPFVRRYRKKSKEKGWDRKDGDPF